MKRFKISRIDSSVYCVEVNRINIQDADFYKEQGFLFYNKLAQRDKEVWQEAEN